MKLCQKCGTPQNDSNYRCVECGAILPAPLNEDQQRQAEEQISDYIEDRASGTGALDRTKHTYIMTAVDALGLILSVVLLIVYRNDRNAQGFLYSALIFLIMGIDTFFPKLNWALESFRIRRFIETDDPVPTDYYLISAFLIRTILPVIAFIMLGIVWTSCSGNPSVPAAASDFYYTSDGAVHVITPNP